MSYNITPEMASVDYLRPMVDRVQVAIQRALERHGIIHIDPDRDLARAAIAAMREPTEGMLNAPREAGVYAADYPMASHEAEGAWEAMIDAALSERSQMKSPSQNPAHIQKGNEQDQDNNNLDHGS